MKVNEIRLNLKGLPVVTVTRETKADFIAAIEREHVYITEDKYDAYPVNERNLAVLLVVWNRHPLKPEEICHVTERRSNYLCFSDGRRLCFDSDATIKYFKYAYGNTEVWLVCVRENGVNGVRVMSYLTRS